MEIDEDVKAFLVEGYENLNQIEADLVALEKNDRDPDALHRVYRALHTIKGNSGFLGLEKLQAVAHAGENLLSRLRDRLLVFNPEITSTLLEVVDALRVLLTTLESSGEEGEIDYTPLLDRLGELLTVKTQAPEIVPESPPTVAEPQAPEIVPESPPTVAEPQAPEIVPESPPTVAEPQAPEIVSELPPTVAEPQALEIVAESPANSVELPANAQPSAVADSSIRLDVALLDKLMNLVGELVLCRNQILEFANKQVSQQTDTAFMAVAQRLNLVTSELQEGVMKTRLQPIRKIWSKFPRVVRDMAFSLGKEVRLEMEGEDTELDKTLIEAIADPLTHLVRNCVDHGLETSQVRLQTGKSPEGRLFLRAFHESGHVNIQISDNGAGIDPEKIKAKALQAGLITSERAGNMTPQECLNLVFLPGLSTASRVTNFSGRGVGMDVVRTNIEKISGTVDIQSELGKGTTFKLKIPLTLAIIPTLIVSCGGDRYAIPQVSLLELVRLEGVQARQSIEKVHGAPVYRLRGSLLPLVYLSHELELESPPGRDTLNIVVLQATDKPFGLVVDAINDTQEIVVKPLGKQLKGIPCFAGATIMGDGKVALILDVQGLAQRAHLLSEMQQQAISAEERRLKQEDSDRQLLLLFQGPQRRRMAIPLSRVARLEEFPVDTLEQVGNFNVIQYRSQIMPLIDLSAVFGQGYNSLRSASEFDERDGLEEDKIQLVVVPLDEENSVGLMVENILDIVEEVIKVRGSATQKGILCSAVIQNRVTEILDVQAVILNNLPHLSKVAS